MRRPKQARKTDRYPRLKTFSHAISLALTGPGQWSPPTEEQGRSRRATSTRRSKGHSTRTRKESHWTPKHGSPQSRKDQATSRSKASRETEARGQMSGGAREPHTTNWRTREPPSEGGPLDREPRTQGTTREAYETRRNGETRDFRTRTSRMANQPRKVETDTVPPASGKHHGKGKGRRQKQHPYRQASLRKHDPSPGGKEA